MARAIFAVSVLAQYSFFCLQALQVKGSENSRNLYCSVLLGSTYIIDLHMFHRALWWFRV